MGLSYPHFRLPNYPQATGTRPVVVIFRKQKLEWPKRRLRQGPLALDRPRRTGYGRIARCDAGGAAQGKPGGMEQT